MGCEILHMVRNPMDSVNMCAFGREVQGDGFIRILQVAGVVAAGPSCLEFNFTASKSRDYR